MQDPQLCKVRKSVPTGSKCVIVNKSGWTPYETNGETNHSLRYRRNPRPRQEMDRPQKMREQQTSGEAIGKITHRSPRRRRPPTCPENERHLPRRMTFRQKKKQVSASSLKLVGGKQNLSRRVLSQISLNSRVNINRNFGS